MTTTLTLNNDVSLPAIGYGVFQTPPDETATAVETALKAGYRHIDTAAGYNNERGVGEGLRRSGLARDDVFLETKVWVFDYGYDETLHAFTKSAAKLGVDVIDLPILHQPMRQHFERTREAYRALERLLTDGRVRAIGVSNFMPHHPDDLMKSATVVPAVNQVELHPYFAQPAVQAADAARGILTQAWSPVGGITFYPGYGQDRTSVLDDSAIQDIAAKAGKTAAQVMLRWHLQQGRSAIPKSTNPQRIEARHEPFSNRDGCSQQIWSWRDTPGSRVRASGVWVRAPGRSQTSPAFSDAAAGPCRPGVPERGHHRVDARASHRNGGPSGRRRLTIPSATTGCDASRSAAGPRVCGGR